jgi:hypothetical protein
MLWMDSTSEAMGMTTVQITLPDQLAQEAQRAGLLSPARLEQWIRDELRARQVDSFFSALDRMSAVDEPTLMSPEEVSEEIARMRADRRTHARA